MYLTITSIKLKSPWHFFALSRYALDITRQLRSTPCQAFKKRGIWTMHYTMTLWNSKEDLQDFARSGAHLDSMKQSKQIASEINTLTLEAEKLPSWEEAKRLLSAEGKLLRFEA